jgi:AAHS family 4-hydroxybenzoate transporter-like MFS transporter
VTSPDFDRFTLRGADAPERNIMPLSPPLLRLSSFIDERRMSPFQCGVLALCGLVMLLDGFDTQSISYAVPLIAQEWHLSVQLLGPISRQRLLG